MALQYDAEAGEHNPIMLTTATEHLLKDLMVALKQTRSELHGIKCALFAIAEHMGVEVPHGAHGS